jgi:Uma2 family endonuclease
MVIAMPAAPLETTPRGRPFTRADLDNMPDDGRRYEIVDGVLIVSAAPGRLHQRAVLRMTRLLDDARMPEFEVLPAPFAVGLADDTELQPDVVVARVADLTDRDLPAAPALAVEVLSHSTKLFDLNVKKERLRRAGAPAYWAVDPVARPAEARLLAWELGDDGAYHQVADVHGDEAFEASVPFPVRVVPAELVCWPPVT